MSWPAWPKGNEKSLAGYAVGSVADAIRLPTPTAELFASGNLSQVVQELYEAFETMDIRWSRELYRPDDARQAVRTPDDILNGAGDATCLDLALLLAGAALGKDLLPIVVILDGHALVAVSTRTDRRGADTGARRQREHGEVFPAGVLTGEGAAERVRDLVSQGEYVMVECTGFALAKDVLNSETPEGAGRVDGLMPYDRATQAGIEQLDFSAREFRFAIDVAYLQDVIGIEAYDPGAAGLERINTDLRRRHRLILDDNEFVVGRDAELLRLDAFIRDRPSGYCLVTGDPGTGKTALLAEWVRRRTARSDARTIYHFISRQYGTADRQADFFQSLLQQASWAWGRSVNATGSTTALESSWLDLLDAGRPPRIPVVIVIDGADECAGWALSRTSFPRRLPDGVHLVISARGAQDDWRRSLGIADAQPVELFPFDDGAVRAILQAADAPAWLLEQDAFALLSVRAQGDPFYVRLLCESVQRGEIADLDDLARMEHGLENSIEAWCSDLTAKTPDGPVQSLLSYLAVALAPMTSGELIDVSESDPLDSFSFKPALDTVKRYVRGDPKDVGLAFAHWRIKEYISHAVLSDAARRKVTAVIVEWCNRWPEHHSRYALTKVINHHLHDLDDSPGEQGPRLRAVVELIRDHDYQTARVEKVGDGAGLVSDMNQITARLAAAYPTDVGATVTMAIEYADARRRWLQPAVVFDLARSGRWMEASDRLELLSASDVWRAAARLLIAWLAADVSGAAVRPLLDDDGIAATMLTDLHDRVLGSITQMDRPVTPTPPDGNTDSLEQAQQIIALMSVGGNVEGLADAADAYGTEEEGAVFGVEVEMPILVAAAAAHPGPGDELLDQYIELQGANPYSDYRNRSLAVLLEGVAKLPNPWQARRQTVHVVECALNPSPVQFCDFLELRVEGRKRQKGGSPGKRFLRLATELESQAIATHAGGASNPYATSHQAVRPYHASSPSPNDLWSFLRRRMAAAAETLAGLDASEEAARLLDRAMLIMEGFAGFRAPAFMTLAEANLIVRPETPRARLDCVERALVAAHNIQDPSFCARSTAMVNAVRRRLDLRPDITAEVEHFVSSPSARAVNFGSQHAVGEPFSHRERHDHVPIDLVSGANKLEQLALDVFHLPVAALEYANPGLSRSEQLALGSYVIVPDPAFTPLMATWLSADTVAAELSNEEKARLIALLVPCALSNPTALDTLLARLVGVAPTVDVDDLSSALGLVATFEPQGGSEYYPRSGHFA